MEVINGHLSLGCGCYYYEQTNSKSSHFKRDTCLSDVSDERTCFANSSLKNFKKMHSNEQKMMIISVTRRFTYHIRKNY